MLLVEDERTSVLKLLAKISPLQPVTAMRCGDPRWKDPNFEILRNVQFWHICGGISFWSNFGRPKIWVFPCWVTTPHGCHWPQLTNSGRQFQQWSLFTFKQYCLEGILAKESSPRTKDFLLWRDLLFLNRVFIINLRRLSWFQVKIEIFMTVEQERTKRCTTSLKNFRWSRFRCKFERMNLVSFLCR